MIEYCLIEIVLLFFLLSSKRYFKILSVFVAIVLIFFSAVRGNITSDYSNYVWGFQKSIGYSWKDLLFHNSTNFEPGFAILVKTLGTFFGNNRLVLFGVISGISIVLLLKSFKGITRYPKIAIFIYVNASFYFMSWNLVRQFLAASLIAFAFHLFFHGKRKKAILFTALAVLTHVSSLIVVPVFLLLKYIKVKHLFISITIISVICFIFLDVIIATVGKVFYSDYFGNGAYGMSGYSLKNLVIPSVVFVSTLVAYYYNSKSKRFLINNTKEKYIMVGVFIYFVSSVFGLKIEMMQRFSYLFAPFACIGYAQNMGLLSKNKKSLIYIPSALIITILCVVSIVHSSMFPFRYFNSFVNNY